MSLYGGVRATGPDLRAPCSKYSPVVKSRSDFVERGRRLFPRGKLTTIGCVFVARRYLNAAKSRLQQVNCSAVAIRCSKSVARRLKRFKSSCPVSAVPPPTSEARAVELKSDGWTNN